MRRDGFSIDELNRSKMNLQHYYDNLYAERYGTNSRTLADTYRRHFLLHESTMDVSYRCGLASEILPQITMQDVHRAGSKNNTGGRAAPHYLYGSHRRKLAATGRKKTGRDAK